MKKIGFCAIAVTLVMLIFSTGVFAYIDPGTGSVVLQIILAVLLGGLFLLKSFWAKIINRLKNLFNNNPNNGNQE